MWDCKTCECKNEDTDRFCVVCGAEKTIFVKPIEEHIVPRESVVEPKRYTSPSFSDAAKPSFVTRTPSDAAVLQEKYDDLTRTANYFKAGVLLCVLIAFILSSQAYTAYSAMYTIFNMALGFGGQIEQICSIVFLVFAILPAIFILISFDSRKRNLPATMAWVSLFAVAIYCGVLFFGNVQHTAVPVMIVMSYALCVLFATMYVKKLIERENALFKKPGIDLPKEHLYQPDTPTRGTYHPEERASVPDKNAQSDTTKSRLKSTMR
jgi:hypothetical protein